MSKHLDVCAMRRSSGRHACDFVRSAYGSDVRLRLTDEFASQTRGIHVRNGCAYQSGSDATRLILSFFQFCVKVSPVRRNNIIRIDKIAQLKIQVRYYFLHRQHIIVYNRYMQRFNSISIRIFIFLSSLVIIICMLFLVIGNIYWKKLKKQNIRHQRNSSGSPIPIQ